MTESRGLASFEFPGEGGEPDLEEITKSKGNIRNNIIAGGSLLTFGGLATPTDLLLLQRITDFPNPTFINYFNFGAMVLTTAIFYGLGIYNLRRAYDKAGNLER